MKTKSNMKTKSVVSALCALLGFAALADSYTFTTGTVIPLGAKNAPASHVTTSGSMAVASEKHVDSTKKDGTLTINLNNATAGDYVLWMLGTADNYTSVYTLTVTDGSTYTRAITVNQKNTRADTKLSSSNLNDSNSTTVNAQPAFLDLDDLPEGDLTLTFKIDSSTGNWAGNYGYFTIYNSSSVPALDVSTVTDTALSSLSSQSYISTCYTNDYIQYEGNGVAFGSTKHGAVAAFALNVPNKATVSFAYDAGSMNSANTVHKWMLLSNDSADNVSETFTKEIAKTSGWWGDGVAQNYSMDFGLLPAGYYTLCCYVTNSDTSVWAGNFGNFTFTYEASTDLDIDDNYTLTENVANRQVNISGTPEIDLAGYNMTLVQATTALSGTAKITNTSDTLSTLTLKNLTDSTLLTGLQFTGNIQLVIDGWSSDVAFNNNTTIAYDAASANSHTGGTTLQNTDNTKKLTIYNQSALGSGTITFNGNAYLAYPDSNAQSKPTFANNICVHGTGNQFEGAFGGQSSQVNFNGDWSGDGELWMFNSWQPEIFLNNSSGHSNESFTGTLLLTDNRDSTRGYHLGDYSTGFPGATVCLTNRYASNDRRQMEIYLQTQTGVVKFGRLMTDQVKTGEGYTQHTNTCLIANHTGNSPVYIGAKQRASDYDIFSGYFKEQSSKTFSLTKEGAGTLELNGQTESQFSQGITVSAGTLILNTTVSTATEVTVEGGAQFYGTVPASGSVTYQSGAIIDCDTAHTITGDVALSSAVVSGTNPVDGQVFLTVNGTATGKPSLSAALAAVSKHNGKHGKWSVNVATAANGVTTYSLGWRPTGLIIIVR